MLHRKRYRTLKRRETKTSYTLKKKSIAKKKQGQEKAGSLDNDQNTQNKSWNGTHSALYYFCSWISNGRKGVSHKIFDILESPHYSKYSTVEKVKPWQVHRPTRPVSTLFYNLSKCILKNKLKKVNSPFLRIKQLQIYYWVFRYIVYHRLITDQWSGQKKKFVVLVWLILLKQACKNTNQRNVLF